MSCADLTISGSNYHSSSFNPGDPSLRSANALEETDANAQWNQLRDQRLIPWGQRAGEWIEDDVQLPTKESIRVAHDLMRRFRVEHARPPSFLVEDGEGGIVFRYADGDQSASIMIDSGGSVEFIVIQGNRLVSRIPLNLK